jgi:hypothetical protein
MPGLIETYGLGRAVSVWTQIGLPMPCRHAGSGGRYRISRATVPDGAELRRLEAFGRPNSDRTIPVSCSIARSAGPRWTRLGSMAVSVQSTRRS